ncbi:glutaredoxin domain-containing protein [Sphingomonas daechungensis]|uniref:glutaredoxin domain-containing protein n=1 Tax=Sphingomonas daechungensis TaxID=1176646 RepID=UPI0037836194
MTRQATLFRMVLPDHTCPYGVRAKEMLEACGFQLDDRILRSREEVETFKAENNLATTPFILIDDEPIGGTEELERYLATT